MQSRLTPAELAAICSHMNDDHEDALLTYAHTFGGVDEALAARMASLDATGFDLEVEAAAGRRTVRIAFDHELADADDARHTLIRMAGAP